MEGVGRIITVSIQKHISAHDKELGELLIESYIVSGERAQKWKVPEDHLLQLPVVQLVLQHQRQDGGLLVHEDCQLTQRRQSLLRTYSLVVSLDGLPGRIVASLVVSSLEGVA